MNLALVFIGGGVGSALRYLLSGWVAARFMPSGFPAGTLAVNLAGCLIIGLVSGWWLNHPVAPQWKLLVVTGLLGGFTTFSAFSIEMLALVQRQAWGEAAAYALISVIAGLGLSWLGFIVGQRW